MFLKSSPTSLAKLALLVAIITLVGWLTLDGNQIARSAFIFLLILGGLVFVHELAHFVTARLFQIRVEEFAVGMPPRILSVERGGTRYSLNFLPLGGYVKMEGEEHNTSSDSFAAKPAWQRLIVLGAGGITNLLVPIILFAIALIIPHEVAEGRAVVAGVVPSGPAASAGVKEGDLILAINGRDAHNLQEAARLVRIYSGSEVDLTVRRSGEILVLPVEARRQIPEGQGPTGITITYQPGAINVADGMPFTQTVSKNPVAAIGHGTRLTIDTLLLTRNEIFGWFAGNRPQFMGPVGIAKATGDVAAAAPDTQRAISPLLELAALLSINLGIINLLPLPALDGGRILFVGIELLRGGKRVDPKQESLVHFFGFAAFIFLVIVITWRDITQIISG